MYWSLIFKPKAIYLFKAQEVTITISSTDLLIGISALHRTRINHHMTIRFYGNQCWFTDFKRTLILELVLWLKFTYTNNLLDFCKFQPTSLDSRGYMVRQITELYRLPLASIPVFKSRTTNLFKKQEIVNHSKICYTSLHRSPYSHRSRILR